MDLDYNPKRTFIWGNDAYKVAKQGTKGNFKFFLPAALEKNSARVFASFIESCVLSVHEKSVTEK